MAFTTTVIRNVEIPPTLPDMDTLTDLTGNIALKDVRNEDDGLRVEGDLLWRGYFEEGGNDCLWEGAEFFSEHLTAEGLPREEFTLLKPEITGLKGEALSESTFRMEFEIQWRADPDEEPPLRAGEPEAASPTVAASVGSIEETVTEQEPPVIPFREETASPKAPLSSAPEQIREHTKPRPQPAPPENNTQTPDLPPNCPCPRFCLRYYRVDETDNLEKIAARFSASVAKLKECNNLGFEEAQPGKMLRIP